jgi:hypothetical protein
MKTTYIHEAATREIASGAEPGRTTMTDWLRNMWRNFRAPSAEADLLRPPLLPTRPHRELSVVGLSCPLDRLLRPSDWNAS